MHVGSELLPGNADNLDGFFESAEAMHINEQILGDSGGSWHAPPEHLTPSPEVLVRARQFLNGMAAHPVAGWKDPRTVITYPVWRRLLEDHWVVACLRRPEAVARSLAVREDWPLERGRQLWLAYNARLREHVAQHPRVLWFVYDRPLHQQQAWLRHACDTLGLTATPAALAVFDQFQRHQSPDGAADAECEALYQDLLSQALASWQPPELPAASAEMELSQALESLVQINHKHNALLQRLERQLRDAAEDRGRIGLRLQQLEGLLISDEFRLLLCNAEGLSGRFSEILQAQDRDLSRQREQLTALQQGADELQAAVRRIEQQLVSFPEMQLRLAECHSFIERLRQTVPFRMARKAVQSVKQLWPSEERAA